MKPIQSYDYHGKRITVELAKDGMSGKVQVWAKNRVFPIAQCKSLDEAMRWIDSPLTIGLYPNKEVQK